MTQGNDFEDDQHVIVNQQGVLAGGAFDEVEKVREKPTRLGYEFQCTCNGCARPAKILIPWDELITASAGAIPLDQAQNRPWSMQNTKEGAFMFPAAFCPCGVQYPIAFTPDKAARMVDKGINMRALDPQQVHQQVLFVKQQMQGYQRR